MAWCLPAQLKLSNWFMLQLTTQGVPSRIDDTNCMLNLKFLLWHRRFCDFTIFRIFLRFSFEFLPFYSGEEGLFDLSRRGFGAPMHRSPFWSMCTMFKHRKWLKEGTHLSGLIRLSASFFPLCFTHDRTSPFLLDFYWNFTDLEDFFAVIVRKTVFLFFFLFPASPIACSHVDDASRIQIHLYPLLHRHVFEFNTCYVYSAPILNDRDV
jgi:hypothetical protein